MDSINPFGSPVALTSTPANVLPPDQSGASAFSRFRYQALVAFPLALSCALGEEIVCLIPEYIEDLALESRAGWRLVQVKTRDPELGPWKLRHILGQGGGLDSLLRSFRAIHPIDATYELWLEGALARGDSIESLRNSRGGLPGEASELAKALDLSEEEVLEFLPRLHLKSDLPLRQLIRAHNLRTLGERSRSLGLAALEEIHDKIVSEIEGCMTEELRFRDEWPKAALGVGDAESVLQEQLTRKKLTQERLAPYVEGLSRRPRYLLTKSLGVEETPASVLEEKLAAGGADERVISDAKLLRAHASIRETENTAAALYSTADVMADVRTRLRILSNGLAAKHAHASEPAIRMWSEFLSLLPSQAASLDPDGVLGQDPALLLGEICQLADLCETAWGVSGG